MSMVYLKKKNIKGHPYWYAIKKKRINGQPKDELHVYLGSANEILRKMKGVGTNNAIKVKSFSYGKIGAVLAANEDLKFSQIVNSLTNKREEEGLTVGEYLLFVVFGRWCGPLSKTATAKLFSDSYLKYMYNIPHKMNAQNILNHMEYIDDNKTIGQIELEISKNLIEKGLSPSTILWDTTNFATCIEKGGKLPKKGKSKEKRYDKNLVGVGLAISEENIPFMHESYSGNKHDSTIITKIVDKIVSRLDTLNIDSEEIVIVIDAGNNSEENIDFILDHMHIIGSLRRDQVKSLLKIPLSKYDHLYTNEKKHEIYGYKTEAHVFGRDFTVVISYNAATKKRQKETYRKHKRKFLKKMKPLKSRYERKIGRGKKMQQAGAIREIKKLIPEHLESVFKYEIIKKPKELRYWVDSEKEKELYLAFGKNPIFTDLEDPENWSAEKIVRTYNMKYLLEEDFKFLKDKLIIPIKPFYVWTDESIRVHVFLCIIGLLFLRYLLWRLREFNLSGWKLFEELENIRIAFVKHEGKRGLDLVVEDMSPFQSRIYSNLDLGRFLK